MDGVGALLDLQPGQGHVRAVADRDGRRPGATDGQPLDANVLAAGDRQLGLPLLVADIGQLLVRIEPAVKPRIAALAGGLILVGIEAGENEGHGARVEGLEAQPPVQRRARVAAEDDRRFGGPGQAEQPQLAVLARRKPDQVARPGGVDDRLGISGRGDDLAHGSGRSPDALSTPQVGSGNVARQAQSRSPARWPVGQPG